MPLLHPDRLTEGEIMRWMDSHEALYGESVSSGERLTFACTPAGVFVVRVGGREIHRGKKRRAAVDVYNDALSR